METNPAVIGIHETPATETQSHQALVVLAAALTLGALGDGMLRATPWGVNLVFCSAALAFSATALARRFGPERARVRAEIFAPAVLFATGCAWRDSAVLKGLDFMGMLVALALAAWHSEGGHLIMASVSGCVRAVWNTAIRTLFGAPGLVFSDVAWTRLPGRAWHHAARGVIGGLIALPLLLVFGALFASADAMFERLILSVFDIDFTSVISHVFLTALLASLAGGYLRGLLLRQCPDAPPRIAESGIRLGNIEAGVALGCLNGLFLTFIIVQFRYFFGGTEQVHVVPGLTYATYARQGFFELVVVAALVLPVLLAVDWLTRNEARKKTLRLLSGALAVMLLVIMASAFQRMRIYQHEYGLTELRLYTTAFMGWLAVVCVWFGVTVLRGRRERFVCGALVAGLVAVFALHVINPDALIVRVNVVRVSTGQMFDASYATSLSVDAVPALVEALPKLPPLDQNRVVAELREKWLDKVGDWRNWNWACAAARRHISEYVTAVLSQVRKTSGETR